MLNWFSSKQVEEVEEEIQPENDTTPYLKNCIYEDENVMFYQTDARDFVPYINNAKFQRAVDKEHVKKLKEELKLSNHCVGTFKMVKYGNKIDLIDGQHRVLALHENMEENSKFNMNLILELYTINNEIEQREWFRRANNVKNFEEEDLPNVSVSQIVDEVIGNLKKMFQGSIIAIKIIEKKNVYRPKINEQDLNESLTKYVTHHEIRDAQKLYNQIIILNNKLGLKKYADFKDITRPMWDKVKISGFYIGLYKKINWAELLKD